ncbi:MAG: YqjF family protein [Phycisphaerales bacterium JB050]
MDRVFLTTQWRDLILANYAVEPSLLESHLPPGLELDLFDGRAVCSLVGFRFVDCRVLGVRWPGFVNFPEINLRFYVRERASGQRGVVFVRELVRSRFVALVARRLYNEPYSGAQIRERVEATDGVLDAEYRFERGGATGCLSVRADAQPVVPSEDSAEHWFKEHQWGYGTNRKGALLRYEVQHPVWACHRVLESSVQVDWAGIYGEKWAGMNGAEPLSVMLAVGSGVSVRWGETVSAT